MSVLSDFPGLAPIHNGQAPGAATDILAEDITPGAGAHKLFVMIQLAVSSVVNLMVRKKTGNTKAMGSITVVAGANLADGDDFTLDDGTNPAVNFEYDSSGAITGDYAIPFTATRTAQFMRDETLRVIQEAIDAEDLDMTAEADPDDEAVILLTSLTDSEDANVAATEAVTHADFEVDGMDGWAEDGEVVVPFLGGEQVEAGKPRYLEAMIHGDFDHNLQLATDGALPLLILACSKDGA